jgi:hypothetical protein
VIAEMPCLHFTSDGDLASALLDQAVLDGKSLDTSMTEPGYHFLIHFDRMAGKKTEPNLQNLPREDQTASKP